MDYFDDESNVNDYFKMCEGYDGREVIEKLKEYLAPGSSILELGMGPGKDLDMLAEFYTVTGSDSSQIFLDRYRKNHPKADLMKLDAVRIETDRTFDCIYSNKVLVHLKRQDLPKSFYRQLDLLNIGGIAAHTLWRGEKEENYNGLRFVYYQISELKQIIPKEFEIIITDIYKEMEKGDSIFIILKKLM